MASFNPRTHTGCDTSLAVMILVWMCFNPRTHTGCDFINANPVIPLTVSIHAPTRGATVC